MRKIAQGLKELGTPIDLVLTSPYLRAVDTARIVAKRFDLDPDKLIQADDLSPVGQADRLVNEIDKKYGQVENIALVGHEPSLSRLISMLLSGDPTLPITLKKGGVCRLSVEKLQYGRCATLEWLLAPAQLV
jgi:phosphohistidine phosphatase